ncbi:MAG TPA: carbohydrate porin [Rhizomicrobium sp.]|nr:carbohydrate porin [Rhizomicrobium sp.]
MTFALFLGWGAANAAGNDRWSVHGQMTNVWLFQPGFTAPYTGPNSLDPRAKARETFDATLFVGVRLFDGFEIYANPEIDQGFGLSNTLGVAGYPSGEAYKVGKSNPYVRLQRLFGRLTIDLGGETQHLEADANQIAGDHAADDIVVTFGKLSAADIFDANTYAHDPKTDFLNWSIVDSGAYDYAADAWGYTYGVAAEWNQDWWTLRAGLFDLSKVPNTTELETDFSQFEIVAEAEARLALWGRAGKVKLLGYINRGRMGSYREAVALAAATASTPDTALVRRYASRAGLALVLEQPLTDDFAAFARLSYDDGSKEAYEFTEINRSLVVGLSLHGSPWNRPHDTVGLALALNGISAAAQSYFAAGGLGILIGDGRLPHYGAETIVEAYYSAQVFDELSAGLDYQFIANPAYNEDRGPVSVLGARLHFEL